MTAQLLILRGVPGSGKSTEAKELAQMGFEIVSRDTLREQLLGGPEVFSDEGLITAVQNAIIEYHLSNNINVVVDNTNTEWKYVRELVALGKRHGAMISVKVIDVTLDEALERNRKRGESGGRRVPDYVIRHHHSRLELSKDWKI